MTNSGWVTFHICEWHSYQIFSFDQKQVSDIAHFVEGSLITSFPMTNSEWVTLHTLWKAVSSTFPMTNREWVTLQILWMIILSHHSLWPTVGEWHYTFCKRQSHHIFSYDQQFVSDIAQFVKGSLITSLPMTNREWVTLYRLWKAVSSHLNSLWPTASEWHCIFCKGNLITAYDQQGVSNIAHSVKGSLNIVTSFPMINRKWVTLHILWKAVSVGSSHIFQHITNLGSEWHCIFVERKSHHIFSYDP